MIGIATGSYSGLGSLPGHFAAAALGSGGGPLIDLKPVRQIDGLRWQRPDWQRPETRLRERPQLSGESDHGRATAEEASAARAAALRPAFSPHATARFVVQLIGQEDSDVPAPLTRHRDGPRLTCEAYRRAGGEPPADCENAQVFRIAV